MIQISAPILQTNDWKNQLANAIRDPGELLKILDLPVEMLADRQNDFPMRVPHSYVNRMIKGNQHDPLFLQVFPQANEQMEMSGFTTDPVGDLAAQVVPGLLHKYYGRVLLTITGACAIHCRYCFRRHFPYHDANPLQQYWQSVLDYIQNDTSITEVILSGGDPLSLSDLKLRSILEDLASIVHVKTLRIHTRLPVVVPDRITPDLLSTLSRLCKRVVMVIHANHSNEINHEVANAAGTLGNAGILMLNQSVLLRNVNDSADTLAALSQVLFDCRVMPYYLHQLDRVAGAAHFAVEKSRATQIMQSLRRILPGYLVPRLVEEKAGEKAKIPLL